MNKLDFIHEKSLALLEKVGFRIMHPGVVEAFKARGLKVDGQIVFFDGDSLMKLVSLAPGGFIMKARNPRYDLALNGTAVNYFPGYGSASITELDGTVREALVADYQTFLKLIEASDMFRINGGIVCQPQDMPPELAWPAMIYMTLLHSEKVVFGMPGEKRLVEEIMELAAIVFGGPEEFSRAPRVMTMLSTLSPLQIDRATVETCEVACKYNQPLMVSPGPMAGATGPINLEANIVMGNAEILATIAVCQLLKPGTPVMYGLQATTTDMKTGGISIGSPGYALQAKYCKAMADYYQLPCRCGGAVNDARELSLQSCYESFLPLFSTSQNGVDLVVHSNGILNSFGSISFEKFMVDLETLSMIKYFLKDLEFTDQTVDIDLFKRVGPGGLFLNNQDTLKKCRTVPWRPKISHRGPLPAGRGLQEQLLRNIREAQENFLNSYKIPELGKDTVKSLDDYLTARGFAETFLHRLKPTIS